MNFSFLFWLLSILIVGIINKTNWIQLISYNNYMNNNYVVITSDSINIIKYEIPKSLWNDGIFIQFNTI